MVNMAFFVSLISRLGVLVTLSNVGFVAGRISEVQLNIPCSDPWVGPYSSYNYSSPAHSGSVVHYTCDDGYQLIGSPTRHCFSNGSWVPDMPLCESKNLTCGFPGHGPHTTVNSLDHTFYPGQVVYYGCDMGYVLVGKTTRVCQKNGKWSTPVPFCAAKLSMNRRIAAVSQNVDVNEKPWRQGSSIMDNLNSKCSSAEEANVRSSYWKVDLLESYKVDTVVLIFGQSTDVKVTLSVSSRESTNGTVLQKGVHYSLYKWSGNVDGREITTYEYMIIQSLNFQFITVETQPTTQSTIHFCEILVLSKRVPSFGQCFGDGPGAVSPSNATTSLLHNTCYTYMHTSDESWATAINKCQVQLSGTLAVDVDRNVQNMMTLSLDHTFGDRVNDRNYWLGAITSTSSDSKGKFPWVWKNGEPIRDLFWGRGQPNYQKPSTQPACVSLSGRLQWQWDDRPCTNRLHFICQHSLMRCGTPDIPEYTYVEQSLLNTNVGTKIIYSCPQGFVLEGERERTCLATGHWSGYAPFCVPGASFERQTGGSSLGIGVIIAIVCGVLLAILLVVAIVIFFIYRKKKSGAKMMKFTKQTESAETLDVDDKKGSNYASTDDRK